MTSVALRRVGGLMLRFALLYGVLLAVALQASLFDPFERPLVASVNSLVAAAGETTRLELVPGETEWRYRLQVERGGEERQLERRTHAHAYVLLLFVALALATPGLSWRQRAGGLLVGGVLSLALGAGLLLSDVQAWVEVAFPDQPATGGLLAFGAQAFDALHRSTGAGLLPLLLWLLYVTWAEETAGEAPRGSPVESV